MLRAEVEALQARVEALSEAGRRAELERLRADGELLRAQVSREPELRDGRDLIGTAGKVLPACASSLIAIKADSCECWRHRAELGGGGSRIASPRDR